MGRFAGYVGYRTTTETAPGVWKPTITERFYIGDTVRNINRVVNEEGAVNPGIKLNDEIRIVADAFAYQNFQDIIYVEYMGTKWEVTAAQVSRPRLILDFGGVYNGQSPTRTSDKA